ncbi:type I restriction-modification system specificity subunit [Novacetimonas hansenii ATCC 23769]|nr:type I restriction-modification system specificity subunit [Novacetimonas hansenii ATCC 23769]
MKWVLESNIFKIFIDLHSHGSTINHLYQNVFENFSFPLPAFPEQQAIASFLDRECGKIDALIAEQERLIALLAEKRQAVISHAVTKGLNPNAPMKDSGIPWIGMVPEGWEVSRLKYLVQCYDGIQMGPFGGMLLDINSEPTGYKVYGQENTISGDFGLGHRWISTDRYNDLRRYSLNGGDLVLTRKGSLGNARLVSKLPYPGIADSDTIRIRVDKSKVYPEFLATLLHEANYIESQINASKRGAILSGLNTKNISDLIVIYPPIYEQNNILNYLKISSEEFDCSIQQSAIAITLLKERRAALISAAVTGKIDVRAQSKALAA